MAEADPENPEMQEILSKMKLGQMADQPQVLKALRIELLSVRDDRPLVFDGFPRDHLQAEDLKLILKEKGIECLALELDCSLDEANRRREKRIHEARELGNPPRSEDLDVDIWSERQNQYDDRLLLLRDALSAFASYRKIETTKGEMVENHSNALKEIFIFAVFNRLKIPKKGRDLLFKRLV